MGLCMLMGFSLGIGGLAASGWLRRIHYQEPVKERLALVSACLGSHWSSGACAFPFGMSSAELWVWRAGTEWRLPGKTVPCWSSQGRETSDQHLSSSWDVPITELGALFTYLFMSFNPQGNFWIQAVITPFHRGKKLGIQRDNCWRSLGRNSRIWTQGLYQSSIYDLGSCFISQDLFLSSRMDFDIGQTWFQVSFSNYLDDIW